jgi:type I restriction enzyme S subunit
MSATRQTTGPKCRTKVVLLGEVVEFNPRFGKDELADDSLASFIPMKCVEEESGRFEPLGDRKVAEVRKGYTPFRDGDVIFAKVTPCMENGKAAVLKGLTNGVGFGSTEFFALRPKNGLEAKYLFHFILQSKFRRDAARNMTGAVGLRRVPKSYLEQHLIPLPVPDEQRRIVAEIEKQLTRLEAGVAALRRVQANLIRYRAAVLKTACEGELVPTESERLKAEGRGQKVFESGEQLLKRILTERRNRQSKIANRKYHEPAAPDTAKLPPLPEGWVYASVEQLGIVGEQAVLTGPFGTNLGREDFTDSGVPMLTISCLKDTGIYLEKADYVSQEKALELDRYRLTPGDLLFSRMASVGRAGIIGEALRGALFNYHIMRLRLEPTVLLAKFYLAYVRGSAQVEDYLREVNHGATRAGINTEQLLNMPVALPPLAEQTRIVAEVERRLSVVEELEAVVSANLQRATRLRQSILQLAFEGKLVCQS